MAKSALNSSAFDDTRNERERAPDELLAAGVAHGLVRRGTSGRTVLRALGGICGLRAHGWKDDAVRIATLLYDGLRYGAVGHGQLDRDTSEQRHQRQVTPVV
ncbi:hypothetical protein ACFWP7_32160 [Streptomyces sp. NPDC058470]|uniref:hypothetical protein n=1 Tax=Streptomyces sp. NPDC058470 TaxID=3346515 RepID=UPI00364E15A7